MMLEIQVLAWDRHKNVEGLVFVTVLCFTHTPYLRTRVAQ